MSLMGVAAYAGPITTVPWDGHPGAVSFTFDDCEISQLNNLGEYFDKNDDIKVTFFLTGGMNAGNQPKYFPMVAKGHEIGNHSKTHADLTNTNNLKGEVTDYKHDLEQRSGAEVISFATPYCYYNDAVEAEIAKEHIVNRNCQGATKYKWDEEPIWERISSDCYQGNTQQSKGNMSEAKQKNAWTVQLNHGVTGGGGYSISKNDMISIMDEAKAQGLWRAPMGRVAAYYRAHFVIDKATSTDIDGGFKVTWKSPHSAMPKSVPLRVKIEGADGKTVKQKGKEVKAESDGSFVIEFMDLELEVVGAAAAPESSSSSEAPTSSSEAPASSSVVASSDGKTPASSSEGTPTSSAEVTSSADAPASSVDAIAQNIHWASQTPTTFTVFSATGVLVKTFVAIPQSAEESFKALQVPHGTYYLKDLKSNYIKKVVK
ncbi:MAG: polysaccharide deacetylase family protein [Fibrobacter sp.]|uniref:polysaccharide deacetylase family protein n=1 Tax=Fibrobacter sp. TaxID=35828 RepID=UPI001B021121|nr:polysaccharide deacetylase family protein [Fibrobacter sp.]MBO7062185.1 polysaccharide deacetylase family protein [Fibrobacter sp.]